jgi:hypothetical protein
MNSSLWFEASNGGLIEQSFVRGYNRKKCFCSLPAPTTMYHKRVRDINKKGINHRSLFGKNFSHSEAE